MEILFNLVNLFYWIKFSWRMEILGISEEKQKEILELIEKQKKAKLSWVAIISQVSEDQLKASAPDLGLVINKDEIMLRSETNEGKRETLIHSNYEKLIQYAIDEHVHRLYVGGSDNKEAKAVASAVALYAIWGLAGAGIGLATLGKPTDPTKLKFGNVETCKYLFDGRIDYSFTKSTEMEPVKEHVYHEIMEQFGQTAHYLVPIRPYYELILLQEPKGSTLSEGQKNLLLSLCDHLDIWIRDFSNDLANNSVVGQEEKNKVTTYQLLLITGEKIESTEKLLLFTKISIYLSYRTKINQLYYELVQKGLIPNLVDFTLNLTANHLQVLDQHIQYLFQEFMKYLTENNLTNSIKLVDLAAKKQ